MSDFKEELSSQIRKLRGQVEAFVTERVTPTVEKATARLKATADTASRLDALIAVLVAKGIITEDDLKSHEKPGTAATEAAKTRSPEVMQPPNENQV
jgi:hypothetical protein